MRSLRSEPPSWVDQYIGIPYVDGGRDAAADGGLDCYGLARRVYGDRGWGELPLLGPGAAWGDVEAQISTGSWLAVDAPGRVGDISVQKLGRRPHVATAVAHGLSLQSLEGPGSHLARWEDRAFGTAELVGWYRYAAPLAVRRQIAPFTSPDLREVPAGLSVAELAELVGVPRSAGTLAYVGPTLVPLEAWHRVRPLPGAQVRLVLTAAGGGDSNKTLRTVGILGVIVLSIAAPYLAPESWGLLAAGGGLSVSGALFSGAILVGGSALVTALIPAPKPAQNELTGVGGTSPSLSGASNSIRRYASFPRVLGEFDLTPDLAGVPITEVVGNDQYLRVLYNCGPGPLAIDNLRFGDTPVTSANFEGLQVEIRQGYPGESPPTIYPDTVRQDDYQVLLTQAGSWVTRTTGIDTEEISVELLFPRGIAYINPDGSKSQLLVDVEVEYSAAGAGVWKQVNGNAGTAGSPVDWVQMDYLFRTPEVVLGGRTTFTNAAGTMCWGFAGAAGNAAKPAYLPGAGYSWSATGYIMIPVEGDYTFSCDGSDAIDVHVDWKPACEWYGAHAPMGGGGVPSNGTGGGKTNHTLHLKFGLHAFRVRVEARNAGRDCLAVLINGGPYAWQPIPMVQLQLNPYQLSGVNTLAVEWYRTGGYSGVVSTTGAQTEAIRKVVAFGVPKGQYDVRVRRTTADAAVPVQIDEVYLDVIRSIVHAPPMRVDGIAMIGIRIKATDQLSGTLPTLKARCVSIFPAWDTGSGSWVQQATTDPASVFRGVLQGQGVRRPAADSSIDLEELQSWSAKCQAEGWTCGTVIDSTSTLRDVLEQIAQSGRATLNNFDGKYSVVQDVPKTVAVQLFTPTNAAKWSGTRVFPDMPHALRVQFFNADRGYQRDERIVLDDGYQIDGLDAFGVPAPGLPAATKFETVEAPPLVKPDLVWRWGRYRIACAKLQTETTEFEADPEHLVARRGSLIRVQHDVPGFGIVSGRVKSLTLAGPNLAGVVMTTKCPMQAGHTYAVRFRLATGAQMVVTLAAVGADSDSETLTFAAPIVPGTWPAVGDVGAFGESTIETRRLLIRGISPTDNLGARLSCVDYSDGVYTAEVGAIPPFDSGINGAALNELRPSAPVIDRIQSDDYVLVRGSDGTLRPRMLIYLKPAFTGSRPVQAQARIRAVPAGHAGGTITSITASGAEAVCATAAPHGRATGDVVELTETDSTPDVDGVFGARVTGASAFAVPRAVTSPGTAGRWDAPINASYTWLPPVPLQGNSFSVRDVEEGVTYQVRVRVLDADGRPSPWTATQHTVIGKVLPPPDVQAFTVQRLSDGTRQFAWNLGVIPPDVNEVVIKYGAPASTWNTMALLQDDRIDGGSPFESVRPPEGTYRFAIRMRDTSGNLSVNPLYVDAALGPPPQGSVSQSFDFRKLGFPTAPGSGGIFGGFKNAAGALEANDTLTWATAPATWALWTDDWNPSTTSFTYISPEIDLGYSADFSVDLAWLTSPNNDAFVIASLRFSDDAVTWSAWEVVTATHGTAGTTRRGRYVQAKLNVFPDIPGGTCATISQFSMTCRAQTREWTINDVDTSALNSVHRIGAGEFYVPVPLGLFSKITSVGLTFNGTGAGWTWDRTTLQLVPGPRVRIYNPLGQPADAVVDILVRGV